ncbi:hypothetical protein [Paraburkholderia caribensis]|uniref:hypothetical protein n=1 Tax=Paraburkholderia caribensis TaxID=75105 RepID=UPI0034D23BAB
MPAKAKAIRGRPRKAPNRKKPNHPRPSPSMSLPMHRLLRLINVRRMFAITRRRIVPALPGHPRRPRPRTMLIAMRRHDRMHRRMPTATCHLHTQMLASAKHFSTPVATRIEMPMTLPIRAHHPQICAAADKHHIAIHDARNINIARR